jgi:hypothetical protein
VRDEVRVTKKIIYVCPSLGPHPNPLPKGEGIRGKFITCGYSEGNTWQLKHKL